MYRSTNCAMYAATPVSLTKPTMSIMPSTKSIICITPYCNTRGTRRCIISSVFISLRFTISFTIHRTQSTQSAPRNGLSFVMLWNVGINHSPPMPTKSITTRCHTFRRVSSPRYGSTIHCVSMRAGSCLPIQKMGTSHAMRQGRAIEAEKLEAVTAPIFHRTMPEGSPITVSAPPQLADITMAQPSSTRCLCRITTSCIMVSIITVVVRLSRLADMMNVTTESVHSIR